MSRKISRPERVCMGCRKAVRVAQIAACREGTDEKRLENKEQEKTRRKNFRKNSGNFPETFPVNFPGNFPIIFRKVSGKFPGNFRVSKSQRAGNGVKFKCYRWNKSKKHATSYKSDYRTPKMVRRQPKTSSDPSQVSPKTCLDRPWRLQLTHNCPVQLSLGDSGLRVPRIVESVADFLCPNTSTPHLENPCGNG